MVEPEVEPACGYGKSRVNVAHLNNRIVNTYSNGKILETTNIQVGAPLHMGTFMYIEIPTLIKSNPTSINKNGMD